MGFNVNSNGWPTKALIDCTADGVISYGIVQPGQNTEDGVPIVRVNNFKQGRLDVSDVLRVAVSIEENYKRTRLRGGEVLLTLVGSTGQTVIAAPELAGWNVARAIAVIRPADDVGAKWISICLQSVETKRFLDERANTTVQKTLNLADVKRIPIPVPTEQVRRPIESLFSSLDEKIDLHRRVNQTLEAMAQAIFKSWFVDFDPVKAKIAANEQGQDPLRAGMRAISGKTDSELDQMPREHYVQLAATAALFPDEMEESQIGEIPRGWKEGVLADVCHLNPESWSAKALPNKVNYVDLANAKSGEILEFQEISGKDIPSRARRVLRFGDTIIGTVRPGNRSFALIGRNNLTGSTGFAVLRPNAEEWLEFVYIMATSESNIDRLTHLADGGAYPAVRPEVVAQERGGIPDQMIVQEFHKYVHPFFVKITANRESAETLAELRVALLPELLSGNLSFKCEEG